MQLLQLLRGLRIAVSKTIPQPYLRKITRNQFQGNPFQTVFFHSLSSNNKGFLHIRQFSCLLTRIAAIGMPQFTLKSWNDVLNTSVPSLLNSGNRSSKLAVSATNMESSSPLVSEISSFSIGVPSLDFLAAQIFWWRKHETDRIIENNLQKRPPWCKSETLLNERFAAWVGTAHRCLDTYGRRATIAMWTQQTAIVNALWLNKKQWFTINDNNAKWSLII